MPYPFDIPKAKHDIQSAGSIEQLTVFETASQLYAAVSSTTLPSTTNLTRLSTVYSYPDAPTIPLSRTLTILGVAPLSLVDPLVNALSNTTTMDSPQQQQQQQQPPPTNVPTTTATTTTTTTCTLAVKRADGRHKQALLKNKPSDVSNSINFANLVRHLHNTQQVAILGTDKYGRCGLLSPNVDVTASGEWEAQDFCCPLLLCSDNKNNLGQVLSVPGTNTTHDKQQQQHHLSHSTTTHTTNNNNINNNDDNDGFWKPHTTTRIAPNKEQQQQQQDDDNDGFWKPPGTDSNTNDDDPWNNNNNASAVGSDNAWNTMTDAVGDNNNGWYSNNNDNNNSDNGAPPTFHANQGAAAADQFYSNLTRTLESRYQSRLYHMRAFNGWVKATQIQELDPKTTTTTTKKQSTHHPLRILDLACGKGGDLGKWILHGRGMDNYVGIDVARGSLVDAARRARKLKAQLPLCTTFTCADLGHDVPGRLKSPRHKYLQKLSTWSLHKEQQQQQQGNSRIMAANDDPEFKMIRGGGIALSDKFDVVSIQFAIHYMMQTKARARRFFRTVSDLLEIGGNLIATTIDARVVVAHLMNMGLDLRFGEEHVSSSEPITISVGGGACRIQFERQVVQKIFQACATPEDDNLFGLQYTFTLVEGSDHASGVGDAVNLPEWLIPIPVLESLGKEVGLKLEYAQNFHEFFEHRQDPNEFASAHSSLYNMKVLNREGSISNDEYEISRLYAAVKFTKVRESTMTYNDDEDAVDEDEANEIDPAVKAKFLPMALMKAKKSHGDWGSLSSDEKNTLIDAEVRKLASK